VVLVSNSSTGAVPAASAVVRRATIDLVRRPATVADAITVRSRPVPVTWRVTCGAPVSAASRAVIRPVAPPSARLSIKSQLAAIAGQGSAELPLIPALHLDKVLDVDLPHPKGQVQQGGEDCQHGRADRQQSERARRTRTDEGLGVDQAEGGQRGANDRDSRHRELRVCADSGQ
jgi:hypothetical protein